MLTDEELTTRLRSAFDETAPDLTYGGRMPRVRGTGGFAATSVLALATAVALAPAALDHDRGDRPQAVPSTTPGTHHTADGHTVIRTIDLGGVHLTYAEVDGSPGPLYLVVGDDLGVPVDAAKADIDAAGGAEVWFAHEPAEGDPQVYVKPRDSSMVYGVYGQGWTREQLTFLLEHPLAAQRDHE